MARSNSGSLKAPSDPMSTAADLAEPRVRLPPHECAPVYARFGGRRNCSSSRRDRVVDEVQPGQNQSPPGIPSKGGSRQKVWNVRLHAFQLVSAQEVLVIVSGVSAHRVWQVLLVILLPSLFALVFFSNSNSN